MITVYNIVKDNLYSELCITRYIMSAFDVFTVDVRAADAAPPAAKRQRAAIAAADVVPAWPSCSWVLISH